MSDQMSVDMELLIFDVIRGKLFYQRVYEQTLDQLDPDVSASMLLSHFVKDAEATPPRFLLHSTSWRYTDGAIMLTYCAIGRHVCLDTDEPMSPVIDPRMVHGSAERPAPEDIPESAVASHALRHLILLLASPIGQEYRNALSKSQLAVLASFGEIL